MKCIICGKEAGEYGNNAMPIIEGRCCDKCNSRLVVPLRIKLAQAFQQQAEDVENAVKQNRK